MTRVLKSMVNGWIAEDKVRFGDNLELDVYTMKSGKFLVTYARVSKVEGCYRSYTLFEDFYKKVYQTGCKRVTEKQVRDQHSFVSLDAVLVEAKEFYGVE